MISMRFNAAPLDAIQARMKNAARRAPSIMKTAMRQTTKPFMTDVKKAFGEFQKTGAMRRSVGVITTKGANIKVGVRWNYKDTKTGKVPNKYAAQANARNGDPFGSVWDNYKDEIPQKIMRTLEANLIKKGF